MGARADEAYVQLGLPPSLADERVLELADGMAALAARAGVTIAGGDIVAAPMLDRRGDGRRERRFASTTWSCAGRPAGRRGRRHGRARRGRGGPAGCSSART